MRCRAFRARGGVGVRLYACVAIRQRGAAAPLRHVKFLRKEDRDPPAACPALPPGTGWKGD